MTRSLWSRGTTLFVGLWFMAVSAGPEFTHACAAHGAHAVAASLDASHGAHASLPPQARAADHHSASDTNPAPDGDTQCTCLGRCCCTPPVAFLATSITLTETATVAARDAGLPDYAYVPVAAQHVLPFAHAPPLSA